MLDSMSNEDKQAQPTEATDMSAIAAAKRDCVKQTTLTPEQLQFYREEGYLIIKGLFSKDDAKILRDETMGIMDKIGLPMTALRQSTEYLEGSNLDGFVNSANLLSVASQLMSGPSTLYMPFTAVKSGGGGGRFHFHQDNQYTRFDGPGINLWCALNAMTTDNGCLQVVPRSHLAGTLESEKSDQGHKKVKWEPKDFVSAVMEPGDCVAFSRLTVHGSGPNMTDEPRVGYAVQYHRDDVNARRDDGSWKPLKQFPRWHTAPVKEIGVPKGKTDGH
jgi:hypothetical protein